MITNLSTVKTNHAMFIYFIMATFLCFEMALQVSPGVMTQQLMHDLKIDHAGLGFMSGAYFYTYAAMQIPAGLLLARYNIRYVVAIALCFCISGILLLANAHQLWVGVLARILTGTGSAFGFVSVLVVAVRYFPAKQFALLAGIAQLLGAVGAMCGVAPLSSFVDWVGWRLALVYLAFFGTFLVVSVLLFVRENAHEKQTQVIEKKPTVLTELLTILRLRQNWAVAAYAFFSWVPMTAFASLWGIPYLTTMYHFTPELGSALIAMIWIGVAIGSPLAGIVSEWVSSRRLILFMVGLLGLCSGLLVIYCQLNIYYLWILLFIMGIGSAGQALSFAVVKDNNHSAESAALGFNNMAVVITGGLVQPLVGLLITMGIHLSGAQNELLGYRFALWIVPLSFFACMLLSKVFIKESHPQHMVLREKKEIEYA